MSFLHSTVELNNLSGHPEVKDAQRKLRTALAEEMILDFDLPVETGAHADPHG